MPAGPHGQPTPTGVSEAQMASSLLVVDDDDGIRSVLEREGYRVTVADDAYSMPLSSRPSSASSGARSAAAT